MSHLGFTSLVAIKTGISETDRKMIVSAKVLPFQKVFFFPFMVFCLVTAKTFFSPLALWVAQVC